MSAEDEIVIGFYGESKDGIVHVGIVREVESSESRDFRETASRDSAHGSELSGESNGIVREKFYIPDSIVRVGIPGGIEGSSCVDPSESVSCCSDDIGEGSSDESFSIRLEGDRIDSIIGIGIVREVESTISVQASDTISRDSSDDGKYSSDEDLSIGLDRDGSDLRSCYEGDVGIECCIQSSIGVQASEEISPCSCDSGKGSSDEDFSVGLYS